MKKKRRKYLAENRAKKIREEINNYFKKIDSSLDKISILEMKKSIVKEYYSKNSRYIDDDVLICLHNHYSINSSTMSDFFTGLITTLAFTLLWEFIYNKEEGISYLFSSIADIFRNTNWLGRVFIASITVVIVVFLAVIIVSFVKTVFNQVTSISLLFKSYECKDLNQYHMEILSDILNQRKKVIKNKVEYENREKLNLNHRIEVYTLERIE